MPTARELLDQADALMRRNRSLVSDDIPVLTEAVPPETAAKMMQSEVHVEDFAAPRAPFDAPPAAPDALDEVPVLTDAVEEIEMPSIVEPIEPGGEPSVWLDFDDDDARSVIDSAPDSIVVVPDIEAQEGAHEKTDVERDFARELQPSSPDDGAAAEAGPAPPDDASIGAAEELDDASDAVVFIEKSAESVAEIVAESAAIRDEEVVVVGFAPQSNEASAEETSPLSEEPAVVEEMAVLHEEAPVAEEFAMPANEPAVVEEMAVLHAKALVAEEFAMPASEPVVVEDTAMQPDDVVEESAAHDDPSEEWNALRDEAIVSEQSAVEVEETSAAFQTASRPEQTDASAVEDSAPQSAEAADAKEIELSARPVIEVNSSLAFANAYAEAEAFELSARPLIQEDSSLALANAYAEAEAFVLSTWPKSEENASLAPALRADDDARWMATAEEIRMQVLQRIDLFADIGLRDQLGLHLQPIVDRASAELVATINREVGELLRAYVAETIEREIERWRRENGEIR